MDRNLHSSGLKTDQALIIRNGTPGIAADAAAVMAVQDLMSGRMLTENPVYAGPVSVYHAIHCLSALSGEQIIKLMTLGLTEEEAEEQIISGFLK